MIVFQDINGNVSPGILMIEGREICKFEGLTFGLALWISAYYTLNLKYPKEAAKSLIFLQKIILGIEDRLKKPITVSTLFDKLKKNM